MTMEVYGCDFSGARDAAKKIAVCKGRLDGAVWTLEAVEDLEERLDLAARIAVTNAPWGMDMPFSIPQTALGHWGDWSGLVHATGSLEREAFKAQFPPRHSRFADRELFRATDLAVSAKSPISRTPLDMRGMLFGSFKVLHALRICQRVAIYPFDGTPDASRARLYEVYPGHFIQRLQTGRKSLPPEHWHAAFQAAIDADFHLNLPAERCADITSEHRRDAVLACIVTAYHVYKYGLDTDWSEPLPYVSADEWSSRHREGLILRAVPPKA
jgi:hypothetical protein